MTIAGTTIQTSGSTGNGATTQFNFSFHIDPNGYGATTAASQIQVIRETIATGAETVLTLTTDYSVTINADQSSNPGGYITMVSAPSSAYKIWIRLNPDFTQKTDMQAQGAFNAEVVEDEFDQLTRKALWLKDAVRRAPRVGVQAGTSFDGEITGDLTAGYTAVIKNDLSGWQLGAAASATVSAAMASFVNSASIPAAWTALGSTYFPISAYSTLQEAVDAAYANGGGMVIVDRDTTLTASVTLKDYVVILIYPGVTITGGAFNMFVSASDNVLIDAGIIGYGATLAMGASGTGALKLYGPYHCVFKGFRITGSLATSVAIDIRGDVTGGSNPIGNRNPVYCSFADILHSGTCGRFLRLRGEGTDGVSATYPVVLNTFHNMHCEDARVIGIDFARWADHNQFTGITRIGIVGNNAVGVSYNSENPTVNCGVYSNHFSALAVDSFGTYTGRIGLDLNYCKDVLIDHFYQYPLAEGGAYTISADAASYSIGYFYETGGLIQYLAKGLEQQGTATNDNASAGMIGEYIESEVVTGSAVSLTTGTAANITSISLTAGDWDVIGIGQYKGGGTTQVAYAVTSISSTSATLNNATDRQATYYGANATIFGGVANFTVTAGRARISLSATTTIYLVTQCGFSTSTMSAYGKISARRAR